jgi:hypothetical protein
VPMPMQPVAASADNEAEEAGEAKT